MKTWASRRIRGQGQQVGMCVRVGVTHPLEEHPPAAGQPHVSSRFCYSSHATPGFPRERALVCLATVDTQSEFPKVETGQGVRAQSAARR